MKTVILVVLLAICNNAFAQKIFHRENAEEKWQYIYPFKDKTYVLAIQYGVKDDEEDELKTTNIYFGKIGKTDKIFWREQLQMRLIKDNLTYEDYNNDGVKDLVIYEQFGGNGGNLFYNLFLINPKNHTITKVKDFNQLSNPRYDEKHKIILSYAVSGSNYYSVYKINKENKVYQIGEDFQDTDNVDLEAKIEVILSNKYK